MGTVVRTADEILATLREFKEARTEEYALVSLGIFGSVARGEESSGSDVDVVFETDQPNLLKTSMMRQELEDLLQMPVDIVRLRERMNPYLRERILRDGRFI